MKTYNDIYLSARNTLRRHGVEAYALEARILVSCAAEKSVQVSQSPFAAPSPHCHGRPTTRSPSARGCA